MAVEARGERQRRGRRGEAIAAFWLRLKGYRILARNWRHPAGEIDLLARRGRLLVAVEVKWRGSLAAAAAFLARQSDAARLTLRFDVVLLVPGRLPHHIPDAWRPEG